MVHNIAHMGMLKNHQGPASKETADLGKKIGRAHAHLRDKLQEMYVWMSAASDDPEEKVELPQGVVDGMLQGEPAPWHAGGAFSGPRLVLGRRFFVAVNDQARCDEQLSRLPVEKRRLMQWLQLMLHQIRERVQEHGPGIPPLSAPWCLAPQHGAVFWLKRHERKLSAMVREVEGLPG